MQNLDDIKLKIFECLNVSEILEKISKNVVKFEPISSKTLDKMRKL